MKKAIGIFVVLLCLSISAISAQTNRAPVKSAPKKPVQTNVAAKTIVNATSVTEISEDDWFAVTSAMYAEKWETASTLAAQNMAKLKTDNEKKQLAQLRYIYLYTLAGKVSEGKLVFAELERIANTFVGQEFLLVGRQLLADCNTKVNYICAAKDGGNRILRVTATNRKASAIHSFEYVKLAEKFDLQANNEKVAFVGGSLKKVESNSIKSDIKVVRLVFDKGYVKVATD